MKLDSISGLIFALSAIAHQTSAGQNPASPYSPSVFDSNGKFLGPYLPGDRALVRLNGVTFSLLISPDGFATMGGHANRLYAAKDCSGQAYFGSQSRLAPDAVVVGGRIYFANEPIMNRVIRSEIGASGDCLNLGNDGLSFVSGPLNSRSLETLGNYVPPFVVK